MVGARRGSPPRVAAAAALNHMPQDEVPNRALCPDKDVFAHSAVIMTCIYTCHARAVGDVGVWGSGWRINAKGQPTCWFACVGRYR